jgi:HAE1 family hydrophobic/amphiphilic exporter-1
MFGGNPMSNQKLDERSIKINVFGKVAGTFINQFQLTVLVILLIIAVGITGLFVLPKESLPEIVFPSITVQTVFIGASPEDVENLVTREIENKVKDLDDVDSISSETITGLSVVNVTYKEGVDIDQKKIELDNALREIRFSDGVSDPESIIFTTSEIPLMNISVAGDYSLEELTAYAETIQEAVEGVRGVDAVDINGTVNREIEVVLDELKMMTYDLSFDDVKRAIESKNISAPIGELTLNGFRYNLRVDERYSNIEDIENTMIVPNIYIKDIAEVVDGVEPITGYNRTFIRGTSEEPLPSLFLTVTRKVNSDVIGTSENIRVLLEENKGLYPNDLIVYVSNDLADRVQKDLDNISDSAYSGLIVVIIVLFLFIGFKESLIVSITIPLSLLGTLGLLSVFNITFNTFAILGLIVALGLLVDNSIIVMENIDRLRKKMFTASEAALYGTNQVGMPITSATMTTLAAFFPLAILPGILGAFVSTIPLTIMITISVSLFVSLVITPSLSNKILGMKKRVHLNKPLQVIIGTTVVLFLSYLAFKDINSDVVKVAMIALFTTLMLLRLLFVGEKGLEDTKLTIRYSRFIAWMVKKKRRAFGVIVVGLLAFALSISSIFTGALKIAFFPNLEPTSLNMIIDTQGGLSLEDTDIITKEMEAYLKDIPEVTQFNTTVGGREIDQSRISVEIDNTSLTGFDILRKVREASTNIPGGDITIETIAAGPPVGKPIEVRIIGEDLREMNNFSIELQDIMKSIEGLYNIDSSVSVGIPEILLDINENKGLVYGVTPIQMINQLRGEIGGIDATSIRFDDEEVDIVLRKDLEMILDIEEVENLFIATPRGQMLTLSSFADLEILPGISNITRLDGQRLITITADLQPGYNAGDIVEKIDDAFDSPEGIEVKYSGDVEGIEQNFGNLFQSMILAVFLVFIILTLQFKSVGQPFMILTTLPMAFIGVILGLLITGNDFGFYAFMGLIALIGIAVNDAIVLIDYTNYLIKEGMTVTAAIEEAVKTRFNPVLATTLTTISGVLPLAFKEAYFAQFSYALIFGLMITTVLTLMFIPAIYRLFTFKRKAVSNE